MKVVVFIVSLLVCYVFDVSDALPNGPPIIACREMAPLHGGAQTGNSGYALEPNFPIFIAGGPSINVTLSGPDFRGIFLQVRDGNDLQTSQAVGTWTAPSSDYQTIDCMGSPASALGHRNRNDKSTSQIFMWTPPDSCDESTTYVIRATVVRAFVTFQTGLTLDISCFNLPIQPPTTPQPTVPLTTTATTTTTTTEETTQPTQSPEFTPPPELEGCSFSSFNRIPTEYNNGFENSNDVFRGWESSSVPSTSPYQWTVSRGPTPSLVTGPTQAFEGSGFIYTEASSPAQDGDQAILSTRMDLRGCFCFRFAISYNTLGNSHSFSIQIDDEIIGTATNGTAEWDATNVNVDTPNFVRVSIIATRGSNWLGDIGLDQLRFDPGTC